MAGAICSEDPRLDVFPSALHLRLSFNINLFNWCLSPHRDPLDVCANRTSSTPFCMLLLVIICIFTVTLHLFLPFHFTIYIFALLHYIYVCPTVLLYVFLLLRCKYFWHIILSNVFFPCYAPSVVSLLRCKYCCTFTPRLFLFCHVLTLSRILNFNNLYFCSVYDACILALSCYHMYCCCYNACIFVLSCYNMYFCSVTLHVLLVCYAAFIGALLLCVYFCQHISCLFFLCFAACIVALLRWMYCSCVKLNVLLFRHLTMRMLGTSGLLERVTVNEVGDSDSDVMISAINPATHKMEVSANPLLTGAISNSQHSV